MMIEHRTSLLYYSFAVFLIFCANIWHADAGIKAIFKDTVGLLPPTQLNQVAETTTDMPAMARIFYSAIGDLVETVPAFPFTLNVPDMFSAFNSLLSGMYNYITGSGSSNGSQPKDVLGAMINIYRHIAVQEDIHDFEFMT